MSTAREMKDPGEDPRGSTLAERKADNSGPRITVPLRARGRGDGTLTAAAAAQKGPSSARMCLRGETDRLAREEPGCRDPPRGSERGRQERRGYSRTPP